MGTWEVVLLGTLALAFISWTLNASMAIALASVENDPLNPSPPQDQIDMLHRAWDLERMRRAQRRRLDALVDERLAALEAQLGSEYEHARELEQTSAPCDDDQAMLNLTERQRNRVEKARNELGVVRSRIGDIIGEFQVLEMGRERRRIHTRGLWQLGLTALSLIGTSVALWRSF